MSSDHVNQPSHAPVAENILRLPSERAGEIEVFYKDWAKETVKRNLVFANELLRLFVTLNTTLLAGTIVLLNDPQVGRGFRVGAALCFLISLAVSILGVLPYGGVNINLLEPEAIRQHKKSALKHKQHWLQGAALFMLLGLLVAIVGMLTVTK